LPDASPQRLQNRLIVAAILLFLPFSLFYRPLFFGEAFLPADLLRPLAPWKDTNAPSSREPAASDNVAWNVLRFDGITEFYPWRLQAARSIRSGHLPLWNPYQFAARGGTPLLANSQSAPLYPPNILFYLTPPDRFWYAFGLSAALHLLLAAGGMYRFLRALSLHRLSSVFGAAAFCLSAPVITWLALPTFLAVSAWIPWLLLLLKRAHDLAGTRDGRLAALGAGGTAGMLLLAGHLQMAFYGMLAGVLYLLWQAPQVIRQGEPNTRTKRSLLWAAGCAGGLLLAISLALPQVLPALSLSRISHRATGAPPSMNDYGAYVGNALPARQLVTLIAPNFFGNPNDGTHWANSDRPGGNNYAEWALYIGVAPLLMAVFALALPWRNQAGNTLPKERTFFAGLAAITLLLAMGTPLNLPLFFLVPGYSQTGNPARCLILLSLCLSVLGAMGMEALLRDILFPEVKRRAAFIALIIPLLAAAIGASQGAQYAAQNVPGTPFGQLMALAQPDILKGIVFLVLAAGAILILPHLSQDRRLLGGAVLTGLAAVDLLVWGTGYNPSVSPALVYPVTPGIAYLQANGKDARIAVINRSWTLGAVPPRGAALPPNALTVFELHDVGGYDSLFPGDAKQQAKEAGGGEDPSPPANGNIVFVKRIETAVNLGARFVVVSPEISETSLNTAGLNQVYGGPDLHIYENPAGTVATPPITIPTFDTFRIGLFCALCGGAALSAILTALLRRRG
jgi:uncharacterized membrane protein YhaH (DUF805 family)